MVVHCSAGIGRTGAFIVIDSMLRMAEKEKKIDVLGHFCKIRMQRINMVEKFAQYRFVYQVLLEALSHDPTDISCTDFASYLNRQTKGSDKTSLMNKQFEVINWAHSRTCPVENIHFLQILNTMSLCKLSSDVCKVGLMNFQFNRRPDVVPRKLACPNKLSLADRFCCCFSGLRASDIAKHERVRECCLCECKL